MTAVIQSTMQLEEAFTKAVQAANTELKKYDLEVARMDMKSTIDGAVAPSDFSTLGGVCVCYRGVCGCILF